MNTSLEGALVRHVPGPTRAMIAVVLGGLLSTACIAPPPKCSCEESTSGGGSEKKAGGSVQAQVDALELVPVIPDAPLFWDGQNISMINIDPPGSWFAYNDGSPSGSMVPESTTDFNNHIVDGAIHSEGKGYGTWGGGIGLNLVGSPIITPVDATKYKGISFTASGEGWVHMGLATVITIPEFEICDMAAKKCYDHYAADIKLTPEKKTYTYTWKQLRQAGWGAPQAPLDPSTIVGLHFTSRGPSAWNFNLDDLAFIE